MVPNVVSFPVSLQLASKGYGSTAYCYIYTVNDKQEWDGTEPKLQRTPFRLKENERTSPAFTSAELLRYLEHQDNSHPDALAMILVE